MPFDDPTFLNLRNQWYAKLQQSGFRDLENFDSESADPEPLLSNRGNVRRIDHETQAYFEIAQEYFWAHDWRGTKPIDKEIWRLHADGLSVREIMQVTHRRSFAHIHGTIKRTKDLMLQWHKERLTLDQTQTQKP